MKIRSSFVSNSSSSSFVIIGHKIEFDEININKVDGKGIFVNTNLYGCEGKIGCNLTLEIYNHIKMLSVQDECSFITKKYEIDPEYGLYKSLVIEQGNYDIMSGDFDHSSVETILNAESYEDFIGE